MRISAFFIPFIAVLAGVSGFYLRLSERLNVFDPLTGLPERNAATTIWLLMLTGAFLLFVLIFAIVASARHKALPGFENVFGTDPFSYPLIFTIIGITWLAGTYIYFADLNAEGALSLAVSQKFSSGWLCGDGMCHTNGHVTLLSDVEVDDKREDVWYVVLC